MKIGIISDSHDHIENIRKAVQFFNDQKVGYVFHAGDIISPFIAPLAFKELKAKLILVFGNNDGELLFLKQKFNEIGAEIQGNSFSIELEGRKIALFHTLDTQMVDALLNSGEFALIITGHTHQATIKKTKKTLLVNPGETCGYLTGNSTIAIVDLDKMEAELITL
ncbi:MAG: metallophosphoesterase [Candidatus Helarchaeota archaeon]